jgi:hypothetical protein
VAPFRRAAHFVANSFTGPEATTAIRKLVEAKDCAVRAAVAQNEAQQEPPKANG